MVNQGSSQESLESAPIGLIEAESSRELPVLEGVDPDLLAVLLAAIQEQPEAQELSLEQQLQICKEAHASGQFSDQEWLTQRIYSIKMEAIHKATSNFAELNIPAKKVIHTRDDLEDVLAHHRAWQQSVLDPEKPIVGGRANLSDQSLSDMDLSGLDLRGARMCGTQFNHVHFVMANLATAHLAKARFVSCDLSGAILRNADLSYATFEKCKRDGIDFRGANLSHVRYLDDAETIDLNNVRESEKSGFS